MSKLTHRNNKAQANHSLYQTNLLSDHSQLLTDIKNNTANINVNVDSLEVNTDGLETLITATNAKLPSALTGSGNLKVCLQELGNEGSERLNVDVGSTVLQLPTALTGEGNLKVSIQEDHTHDLSTAANQVLHNTKLDSILSKNTDAEVHLGNIDTGIDVLEACVGSNKVNVNIASGSMSLATGASTEAKQDTQITHLSEIEGAVETLEGCVGSNKVNVNISSGNISGFSTSALQTDTNTLLTTLDGVVDNILSKNTDAEVHLGNIDTGIDVLEACVGSNKVNVNISSGNISGFSTSALQVDTNSKLDTLESSLTSMELKQDTQITHLSEIEGAVETLEGCVGSNKVNVNISSGSMSLASGASTSALQGDTNTKLDTLESSLTSMEGKQDTQITHLSEIEGAVETLEGCVGSNKVNVNISSGNISGFSTSALQGTTNTKLDALETTLTAIETDQAALEVLHTATNSALTTIDAVLDTIKVDTEAIETAVEALNARDSLTTTLIIDGQTVSSGGGTHTSSSVEVTNIPPDGKLKFLLRISGVSPADIGVAVQLSADDTNFFGADLGMITQGVATSGVGQFITCNFPAKHIKIQLTNTNGSSTATCTVHMFN